MKFEVIHSNGETAEIQEGILFAVDEGKSKLYMGTRKEETMMNFFCTVLDLMEKFAMEEEENEEAAEVLTMLQYGKDIEGIKTVGIHQCKEMKKYKGIKVVKFQNLKGYYLTDTTVEVKGHDGHCYATAIEICPFCGEKLED